MADTPSFAQYTGDGEETDYSVPFPYLSRDHVVVRVNGEEVDFEWLDSGTVQLDTAPDGGALIDVRRSTPTERMVDWTDGSTLVESDMDLADLQVLYVVQEAKDLAGGSLLINSDGSYSANERRITNVGDPFNSGDAVNRGWAETAMSSQLSQAMSAKNAAEAAEANAEAAQAAAEGARNTAQAAAATATTKAGEAATSASNAATSASSAFDSAGAAAASAASSEGDADDAADSAVAAAASAAAAAGYAAGVNMPSALGKALNFLRQNADASALEYITAAQLLAAISALSTGGGTISATNALLTLAGTSLAILRLIDSGAGTDAKRFDLYVDGGVFGMRSLTDLGAVQNQIMRGNPAGGVAIGNPSGGVPATGGHVNTKGVLIDNVAVGSMALREVTLSTSDPSGGNNGDIWVKYT